MDWRSKSPGEQTQDPCTTMTGWSTLFLITEREISVPIAVFGRCKKLKNKAHYPHFHLHHNGSKKEERSAGSQGSPCRWDYVMKSQMKTSNPTQLRFPPSGFLLLSLLVLFFPLYFHITSFCVTQAGPGLLVFKRSSCLSLLSSCTHTLVRCHVDHV